MSTLGPYRLTALLGRGGLGEVWAAVHAATGAPVAIKLVESPLPNVDPLRDEVEAAAALHHPHIVRVLDFARAEAGDPVPEGRPYLVMQRVEGGTLQARVAQLPWIEVRRLLDKLLDALGASHARGVIHRDVKPANVLLTRDGRVKLADFGLAFAVSAGGARTGGGTPRYMAPEQRDRSWRDHGPCTDLYAVGWLARALVTGEPSAEAPPAIATPPDLDDLLERLTHPEPALRFRGAADVRHALAALSPPTRRPGALRTDGAEPGLPSLFAFPVGPSAPAGPPTLAPHTLAADATDPDAPTQPIVGEALPTLALPSDAMLSSDTAPSSTGPLPLRGPPHAPPHRPPTPADWRPARLEAFPRPLLGVGLGLVGLRVLPMVGREH